MSDNVPQVQKVRDLKLNTDSFITILSTRKSGKSFLIADLIYYYLNNANPKVNFLYVFSNTAKFEQGGNYKFVDKKIIFNSHPDNVSKILPVIIENQMKTNRKYHVLIVFDDIDLSKRYEETIELLAVRGRHYNITTILSAQIATHSVSPSVRNNTSYLFVRKLNAETMKKQVYSMLTISDFEHPQHFYDFAKANINDFQFIFYNNEGDNKEIQLVKADPIPEDFTYKVKAPKGEEAQKPPKRPYGFGAPMDITFFDSDGRPRKMEHDF